MGLGDGDGQDVDEKIFSRFFIETCILLSECACEVLYGSVLFRIERLDFGVMIFFVLHYGSR